MKANKLFLIILFGLNSVLLGQSSFELEYGKGESESLFNVFEDNLGRYISVGSSAENYTSYKHSSVIIISDSNGEIINEITITKEDTSLISMFAFQKNNGNYFVFSMLSDTNYYSKYNTLYFSEFNTDLSLIWEKYQTIPSPYNNFQPLDFLIDSASFVIEGYCDTTHSYDFNEFLSFFRVNFNGEIIDSKIYTVWKTFGNNSAFIFNNDSTGFILYGVTTKDNSPVEWIEINKDFEITSYISTIDPQHSVLTPLSARWLPNGNIFSAGMTGSGYNAYVKLMDAQLNTLQDTLLDYNETTYVVTFNGIDYTDPENIWLGTFYGMPTFFAGEEVFRVHIFNSEGHLKGMKVYGGDMRYWFYNLVSTSDGGCIITGVVPDTNGSWNTNGYLIKVMPGDILTNAEDTPLSYDRDVSVLPNPFDDYLNIETVRKNLKISLFDVNGQKILERDISNSIRTKLSTANIKPGFYFYNVTDNGRIIQSGKLVKK